jgi:hypothetical protein
VAVLLLPVASGGLGGEALPDMAGPVGAWVAGLLFVGALVWWLAARRRKWLAGVVGLVGALAVVNLVAILHVAQQMPAIYVPRERAWLWYWAAVLPVNLDLGGKDGLGRYMVQDVLELTPVLLTAVTAFVVVCVHCAARSPQRRPVLTEV